MTKNEFRSFIDAVIKMREMATDVQAIEVQSIYPVWKPNMQYMVGERVRYEDRLYKVVQAHTTQESWTPNLTPSLFEPIDVVNDGSLANPIIAAAGMCYFKDKYYLDETNGKVYLCTRDDSNGNGTVLHFVPSALVGTYFEVV